MAEQDVKLRALRELLETQIKHAREYTDQRFDAAEKALQIQAVEYERRMHILNNSFERESNARAQTVPVGEYRIHLESSQKMSQETNRTISDLAARVSAVETRWTTVVVVLTLLLSITGWVRWYQ